MQHDLMEDVDPSDVVVKDGVEVVGRRFGTFVGQEPTRPRRRAAKPARGCDPEIRQVLSRGLNLLGKRRRGYTVDTGGPTPKLRY